MTRQNPPTTLDKLWDAVPTSPPPVNELLNRAHAARRRRAITSTIAAVMTIGGLLAAVAVIGPTPQGPVITDPSDSHHPIRPRTYDASADRTGLPKHIESVTRRVLGDLGPSFRPVTHVGLNEAWNQVPLDDPDLRSYYTLYGDDTDRSLRIYIGPKTDPPPLDQMCPATTTASAMLECRATNLDDGTVIVTTVIAMTKLAGGKLAVADPKDLNGPLTGFALERNVEVVQPDFTTTSISERVTESPSATTEGAFEIDEASLKTLALSLPIKITPANQ